MAQPSAVVVDTSRNPHARLRPVPLTAVTLDDEFWAPCLRINREVSLPSQHRLLEDTGRLERIMQPGGRMGIQDVQDDDNRFCLGDEVIDQAVLTGRRVDLGAKVRDSNVTPASQRLEEHEETGYPVPLVLVLVVKVFRLARPAQQELVRLSNELLTFHITADLRALWIVRSGIHVQHDLHVLDKLCPDREDTPALSHPRRRPHSFNSLRTISSEVLSTTFSLTKRSAKSCVVRCSRPSEGSLRASVSRIAMPLSSGFLRVHLPGRGRSSSAPSDSPSTERFRARCTAGMLECNDSAMSRSFLPSSARIGIRARMILRAGRSPPPMNPNRYVRSSSVKST
jgi:hypothetical protein